MEPESEIQNQLDQQQHEEDLKNLEVVVPLMETKFEGTYSNYFDHITLKNERKVHSINGSFIFLERYDGAKHSMTPGK